MELFWWAVVIVLMAVGIIGTVLPVFPGTAVILAAAILHRWMLGPEKSISWWTIAGLALLTLVSYAIDFAGGVFGARKFGATRWGMWGAFLGAIAGVFFGLPGLLIGPIIGAITGELIGGKRLVDAGRAGWGTLLGNLAALLGKLAIAFAMVCWFLVAAPTPF
ncbi:MAG: DUF456 family protein [Chthoniobacterales bacterium]